MVLGILAIFASMLAYPAIPLGVPWVVPGIMLGVTAVIFGGLGLARARRDRVSNRRMAVFGVITGIAAAAVATFLLVFTIRLGSQCQETYGANITEHELEICSEAEIYG